MPHELQRRSLPADEASIEVQTRDDGKQKIVGYGVVFYREGDRSTEYELGPGLRERIMPVACDRAIREQHDVRGLLNHNPNIVLGRTVSGTMQLTLDQKGMRYEIDPPDTQAARDTVVSLKRRDISGSSFGFTYTKGGYEFREEKDYDVLEVRDMILHDTGPVTYPAYVAATSGVREMRSEMFEDYKAWKEGLQEQRIEEQKAKERMDKAKAKLDAMG
jgi:HK97 family phage prohead protease